MAATAGTIAKTYFRAAAGPAPGILEWTYTYSSTTYVANGTIDISKLGVPVTAAQIASVAWAIESSSAAYMVVYTPAASPILTNIGAVQLFTATGTAATGSLTLVLRARALLTGPAGVNASII